MTSTQPDAVVFPDKTLEVVSGQTTAWLPISTPWLFIAACSSQIYAQRAGLGGNLIAFDPLYGESILPGNIPCLPTEVTSSLRQSDRDPATTTLLGPTFVCPGAYSAVQTILLNSVTQQVLCCPSQYQLNIAITGSGSFPSQCTSKLTIGQTLAYESTTPSGPWGAQTTVVQTSREASVGPTVVFAMHVNGFNVVSGSAVLTTSATSSPATATSSPSSQSSASPEATLISVENNSLSGGGKAGIGIGVVLGAIALAAGAWLFWRRTKRKADSEYVVERIVDNPKGPQEMEVPHRTHEMPATRSSLNQKNREVYEMASN